MLYKFLYVEQSYFLSESATIILTNIVLLILWLLCMDVNTDIPTLTCLRCFYCHP